MAFRKSAGISQIENALFFSHLGRREGMLNLRRSDIEESSVEALENEIVGDKGRGWTWQSSYKLLFERINPGLCTFEFFRCTCRLNGDSAHFKPFKFSYNDCH